MAYKMNLDGKRKAKRIRSLHEQVKQQIEKKNEAYKKAANKGQKMIHFGPDDVVWILLRKG
ncbi:hypothetical protein J1N35_041785 [Gossypium stocksii]|uniref:Uncharacterized protein n=1 Tax=Gossypium stocksii TaxID=47602 RepID=A0A9D3UGF1_9ROSI|nr:hypothetical protein J1N35_041785 [Gossypium stocksii]